MSDARPPFDAPLYRDKNTICKRVRGKRETQRHTFTIVHLYRAIIELTPRKIV